MDAYLAKNAEHRAKLKAKNKSSGEQLHSYSLEDYGLSETMVREAFADYISAYELDERKNKK